MDTGTMAISKTPKLNLPLYSSGNDPHPGRVDHNDIMSAIEANAAGGAQGTHATRPGAGVAKRLYFSTDRKTLAWDNGSTWVDLVPIGGQAPKGVDVAGAVGTDPLLQGAGGSEGTSERVARADHVHYIPLATAATAGLMTSAQAALVDGATSSSTANRVAQRDASGRLQVASPAAGSDAATKSYVDTQASNASNLSTGTVAAARLPLASGTTAGAMSAPDKVKLDAATPNASGDTLMLRDGSGNVRVRTVLTDVAQSTFPNSLTRRDYVDAQVSTRAESGHTHAGEDITSGTVAAARLPLASITEPGAMSPTDKELLDNSTSGSDPNTLMKRNAAGETIAAGFYMPASTPQPNLAQAMTRKDYVDAQIATRAAASHNHSAANITSGTLAAARLPLATGTANGAMSAADKAKLDAATPSPTANTLVMNDAAGRFQTATPAAAADVANKGYVDGMQWSGASITSGVISPDRIANATSSLDGLMPKADKEKLDSATYQNVARALVARGDSGQIWVGAPTSAASATTKSYVDGKTWAGSAITSGTINPARIANATSALDGLMSKADKALLDTATSGNVGGSLMQRSPGGGALLGYMDLMNAQNDATNMTYAARRDWVDGLVNAVKLPYKGRLATDPVALYPDGYSIGLFAAPDGWPHTSFSNVVTFKPPGYAGGTVQWAYPYTDSSLPPMWRTAANSGGVNEWGSWQSLASQSYVDPGPWETLSVVAGYKAVGLKIRRTSNGTARLVGQVLKVNGEFQNAYTKIIEALPAWAEPERYIREVAPTYATGQAGAMVVNISTDRSVAVGGAGTIGDSLYLNFEYDLAK